MAGLLGLVTGRSGKYSQISTMPLPLPMVLNGGGCLTQAIAMFFLLNAVFLGFSLFAFLIIVGISSVTLFNAVFVLAVLAGVSIFYFRLSRPESAVLRLEQEGFTEHFLSRERRVRWDNIEYFKVVRPSRLSSKHSRLLVGWRYKAGFQSQYPSRVRRSTKRHVDDYLKMNYGEYPGDLEQLLNELRDRYGSEPSL